MKTATLALVNFFGSSASALQFDLWTLRLASGTLLRWTDADVDITLADGRSFVRGPVVRRPRAKWARGLEVDQLRMTLSGPAVLVDGQPLPVFAAAGGFDGASVLLEHVYLTTAGVVKGALVWFAGTEAGVLPGRMGAEITLKSQLTQLSQQLPRNVYQAGCLNDLFDGNCAADRSAYTLAGTVAAVGAGGNPAITVTLAAPASERWLELGIVRMASGASAGHSRTVQAQTGSGTSVLLQFARPWPFALQPGDTLTATAGCDKTMATCSARFANLARFRGLPFVPLPETVT